jgi:protein-tyrosine phosphatase
MDLIMLDEPGQVCLSPDIDDWPIIEAAGISVVIDLDGDLDIGVPTQPNHLLYIYFPIDDAELPDLDKVHAIAQLGATLVAQGHKVLTHCALGYNRSAFVAGLMLMYLGISGEEAVGLLRRKRVGALFNVTFAAYLHSLGHVRPVGAAPSGDANTSAFPLHPSWQQECQIT